MIKKVAIFVEGQTECIFIKESLRKLYNYSVSIEPIDLRKRTCSVHKVECENPLILFEILIVGNDEGVLSEICDRKDYLLKSNFSLVVGLRDMHSKKYKKKSYIIDKNIIREFIDVSNEILKESFIDSNLQIKMVFAIMEIEAWFLGMYKILEKVDSRLTVDFIKENLHYDLKEIDPQQEFYKPSKDLNNIYNLVGKSYGKHLSEVESIVSKIDKNDLKELSENDSKCNSFKVFLNNLNITIE